MGGRVRFVLFVKREKEDIFHVRELSGQRSVPLRAKQSENTFMEIILERKLASRCLPSS